VRLAHHFLDTAGFPLGCTITSTVGRATNQ
ncbi:uncharacterized protein METZ01_LOCUS451555, partial [marine metagenome]